MASARRSVSSTRSTRLASPAATTLTRELAALGGVRLILTTREDPRVLAAIGLEAAVAVGRAVRIHLVDDASRHTDEVADYAAGGCVAGA